MSPSYSAALISALYSKSHLFTLMSKQYIILLHEPWRAYEKVSYVLFSLTKHWQAYKLHGRY